MIPYWTYIMDKKINQRDIVQTSVFLVAPPKTFCTFHEMHLSHLHSSYLQLFASVLISSSLSPFCYILYRTVDPIGNDKEQPLQVGVRVLQAVI